MKLALLWLALAGIPAGVLVDRVIAIVDKEVITYGELMREARVALVLRENARVAAQELAPEVLDSFLTYLVDQVVIAAQARRIGGIDVGSAEMDRAVGQFAARFSSADAYRAFMRRFDISEAALQNILRRELRNERYIAERMRAWRTVTDEPQANVDPQYQEALERWVKELRAGVELRLLSPSGELELQQAP